jgi:hypothetical protein
MRFVSNASAPTKVQFTKRLGPRDGTYEVVVSVRCNDGKLVDAVARLWTQFMWAE